MTGPPAVSVVTVAAGRATHVRRQAAAVARLRPRAAEHVLVALDPDPPRPEGVRVVHAPAGPGPLPVAAARNTAVAAATTDAVVVLDADCLPAVDLVAHVAPALRRRPDALLTWPVGRLPPLPDLVTQPSTAALARARAAARAGGRPAPPGGRLVPEPDPARRFWSLAFALTPATHARIGGFDPGYRGYGAEDTDYALHAAAAGVEVLWVGGAWSYHQHHPVSSPPVEHLADIVRNARRFRARWGTWPMEGWLAAFAADGLVEWTPDGDVLELSPGAPSRRGGPRDPAPSSAR